MKARVEEVARVAGITGDLAPALKTGDIVMRINPRYFRPAEVNTLLGDPSRARKKLVGSRDNSSTNVRGDGG